MLCFKLYYIYNFARSSKKSSKNTFDRVQLSDYMTIIHKDSHKVSHYI